MRLPRTFQVLAMTKSGKPDESGNYKNWGRRLSKMPKIERETNIKQPKSYIGGEK
jgi:hypothetical protein